MINVRKMISVAALISSGVEAIYIVGKCPKVMSDWGVSHPKQRLDLERLQGDWYAFYESMLRYNSPECSRVRLEPVIGHSKKLQMI